MQSHVFRIKSTKSPSSFSLIHVAGYLGNALDCMDIEYGRSHVYEPHQRTGYKSEIKVFLKGDYDEIKKAIKNIQREFDQDEYYDEFTQTKIKFGNNPEHWPVYIQLSNVTDH